MIDDAVNQLRAAHLGRRIELEVKGDMLGVWDGSRPQLISNLVLNAIRYGAPDKSIRVVVTGHDAEVLLELLNSGPAIDPLTLKRIFARLSKGPDQEDNKTSGLGLGVYF